MTKPTTILGAALAVLAATGVVRAAPELVMDVATGQVIHAEEATRPWFPASTTKMMTAYVALRALKAGQVSLDTPLVASARAASQPPSKIGIRPGQEITLDNALKILMVKSANDLALVIAEGIGGSQEGFARLMNQEAARLGMRESHFVNPHGLFTPAQVTSARDLAVLGRAMLTEFPQFREYWGIGAVRLGNRVMRNTNGLIGRYPGAEGMKTGFVCASGFNVVSLASRGGRTILTVVMGAGSGADRTIRSAQLLDRGFSSWGGGHGTLASLPGSGHSTAPNMRDEICRKGRQLFLGEEEDTGGSIAMPNTDSGSVYAVMMPQPSSSAARSVGGAGAGGRATLGARAELPAETVFLGRTPGSTEVARGAGKGAVSAPAVAFAPPPSAQPGAIARAAAAPARPRPVEDQAEGDTKTVPGAPMQLPGVITTPAPGAIGLRSAGASRGTTAPGAIRTAAKVQPAAAKAKSEPARNGKVNAADKKALDKKALAEAAKAKTDKAKTDKAKAVAAKAKAR